MVSPPKHFLAQLIIAEQTTNWLLVKTFASEIASTYHEMLFTPL